MGENHVPSMSRGGPIVGIDAGNTCCSVAVHRSGCAELVPNEQGSRFTPSCVGFTEHETLLGEAVRAQQPRNAQNTVVDLLRLLGRSLEDEAFEAERAKWRFQTSASPKDGGLQVDVTLEGKPKAFAPARLLSLVLSKLRADAEALLAEPVKEVVVGCPADFDAEQRAALKEASQMGGMRVRAVVPAPLAVAALYVHEEGAGGSPPKGGARSAAGGKGGAQSGAAEAEEGEEGGGDELVVSQFLVVDVGGLSASASVVQHERRRSRAAAGADAGASAALTDSLTIRSTLTERGVGGRSVDAALRTHALKEFRRRQRVDLSDNGRAMSRLLHACEAAKHSLTTSAQAQLAVEADGCDYFCNVSRAVMDDLAAPTASKAAALASAALAAAQTPPTEVAAVLLSGGCARMPRVQAALAAVCPASRCCFGAVSDETVARSCAVLGSVLRDGAAGAAAADGNNDGAVGSRLELGGSRLDLEERLRLPRALAIATAAAGGGQSFVRLAEPFASLPLRRTARFAAPPSASPPLLLRLVELADGRGQSAEAAEAAAEAATAGGGGAAAVHRAVASVAVPTDKVAPRSMGMLVELAVGDEGGVCLSCYDLRPEGEPGEEGEEGDAAAAGGGGRRRLLARCSA